MNAIASRTLAVSALGLALVGLSSHPGAAVRADDKPHAAKVKAASRSSAGAHADELVNVGEPIKVVVNKSFLSPLVELFGDVNVGQKVFVASNTILRADPETRICIGSETNLQDNILFLAQRSSHRSASPCGPRSSSAQKQVSIAHQAVVLNSSIGNFCFIGFHARIENAVLDDGVFVLHGAIVANVHVAKDRIVPIGAVIRTQSEADALPLKSDGHTKFQKDVLHVNHEFAEQYVALYQKSGFDAVSGVSAAPKTTFNPNQVQPTVGKNVRISEFTRIVGDVRIGDHSVIGRRSSIRADEGTPIIIGENASIDDRVTFHALEHTSLSIGKNLKSGHNVVFHGPLEAGSDLTIGNDAILFRSKVGNNVTIGDRAIVVDVTLRDGTTVPDEAIITSQAQADALYWPRLR